MQPRLIVQVLWCVQNFIQFLFLIAGPSLRELLSGGLSSNTFLLEKRLLFYNNNL